MKSVSISASKRVDLGKKEAKLSRAAGNIPCVIYGGKTNQHFTVKENALNNGFDAYLTKPIDRKKIFELIQQYTNQIV